MTKTKTTSPRVTYLIRATQEVRDYTGRVIGYDDEVVWDGADLIKAHIALEQVQKYDRHAKIQRVVDGTIED